MLDASWLINLWENQSILIMILIIGFLFGAYCGTFYRGEMKTQINNTLKWIVGIDLISIVIFSNDSKMQFHAFIFLVALGISFALFYLLFGRFKQGVAIVRLREPFRPWWR